MKANRWRFLLPCRRGGTTRGTSPNGARPGLHWKPLDVTRLVLILAEAVCVVWEFALVQTYACVVIGHGIGGILIPAKMARLAESQSLE